ncbi:DNA N-6-adenine-methyltransferase [Photobacterium leiognathi]|uniref:DNA N-6-adenine-methyltransferase n=1 Tax=Photobacterium leiognathi TaxID=553611 RepID=UPI0029827E7F|nr:DNA N-6-adenine-methyltransferase [Photobacterium leiognathi]
MFNVQYITFISNYKNIKLECSVVRKILGRTENTTDIWFTPKEIITKLGPFDLDPCTELERPWDTATRHFTKEDDGLNQKWIGTVWCNPPYGTQTKIWLEKMAQHNNGIALVFARTETKMFFDHVWPRARGVLFIEGRLRFCNKDGKPGKTNSGAPSVLIAYGNDALSKLESSNIPGKLIYL